MLCLGFEIAVTKTQEIIFGERVTVSGSSNYSIGGRRVFTVLLN